MYKIVLEKKAQEYLKKISEPSYSKVVSKVKSLRMFNEDVSNLKKLKGYKNLYRLRIDDYRVVFAFIPEKNIIAITFIAHRREVYDILTRILQS